MDINKLKDSVEVDDEHILLNKPYIWNIYGKQVPISQVKWRHWDRFAYCLGMFLNYYYSICTLAALPKKDTDYEEFSQNIRLILSNRQMMKYLLTMAKLSGLKKRWMKKHFTLDDYAELFCLMYLYNVHGVKKKFKAVLGLIRAM